MKAEPGQIIETGGIVPLRFIVLETGAEKIGERGTDTILFCTARNGIIDVDLDEFIEVEDAQVMMMTKQVIEDEIGPWAAQVAEDAREAYLEGTGGAEIL